MSISPRVFALGSRSCPRSFRSGRIAPAGAGPLFLALAVIPVAVLNVAQAYAQEQVDSEFSVQRFNPAPGPRNLITTRTARSQGEMSFSAELMANYAYKPFVVERCEPADSATTRPAR